MVMHNASTRILRPTILKDLRALNAFEILERELDEIRLDQKRGKSCETFLNMVDSKLKDHQGIAPNCTQYPDSWYIVHLIRTLEPHATLYQNIVNHQMLVDSIAKPPWHYIHYRLSYEAYVETIRTFCQTIDHANRKGHPRKTTTIGIKG